MVSHAQVKGYWMTETLKLDLKLIVVVPRNYRKSIACNVSNDGVCSRLCHIQINLVICSWTADVKLIIDDVFIISEFFWKVRITQKTKTLVLVVKSQLCIMDFHSIHSSSCCWSNAQQTKEMERTLTSEMLRKNY